MKIENIISNPELIILLTEKASEVNGVHRNSKNYRSFEKRIPNYKSFHILKHEGKILSFAGIYKDPTWPDNILRVVDRMFTFPEFRVRNMNGFSDKKPNIVKLGGLCSGQLLPYQTKLVFDMGKIPFLSIQDLERRKGVRRWLNNRIDKSLGYKLLPKLHYTCGGKPSLRKVCWQNILSTEEIGLPSINISEYGELE
tara:strand:+ start:327 stop:917 length:591 start_codon:yes stop_codon:yes gene_type:complete